MYPQTLDIDDLDHPLASPSKFKKIRMSPTSVVQILKRSPPSPTKLDEETISLSQAEQAASTNPRPNSHAKSYSHPQISNSSQVAQNKLNNSNDNGQKPKYQQGRTRNKNRKFVLELTYEQLTWIEMMQSWKVLEGLRNVEIETMFEERFGERIPREWKRIAVMIGEDKDASLKREMVGFGPL